MKCNQLKKRTNSLLPLLLFMLLLAGCANEENALEETNIVNESTELRKEITIESTTCEEFITEESTKLENPSDLLNKKIEEYSSDGEFTREEMGILLQDSGYHVAEAGDLYVHYEDDFGNAIDDFIAWEAVVYDNYKFVQKDDGSFVLKSPLNIEFGDYDEEQVRSIIEAYGYQVIYGMDEIYIIDGADNRYSYYDFVRRVLNKEGLEIAEFPCNQVFYTDNNYENNIQSRIPEPWENYSVSEDNEYIYVGDVVYLEEMFTSVVPLRGVVQEISITGIVKVLWTDVIPVSENDWVPLYIKNNHYCFKTLFGGEIELDIEYENNGTGYIGGRLKKNY